MKTGKNAIGTVIGLVQGFGYLVPRILVVWVFTYDIYTTKRYMFYMGISSPFYFDDYKIAFSIVAVLFLLRQVRIDMKRIAEAKAYYKIKHAMESEDKDGFDLCDDDFMPYV